jgi:hypothetical protein
MNLSRKFKFPGQDANRSASEYESRVLLLRQSVINDSQYGEKKNQN